MILGLLMEAGNIPLGSTVTKKTGEKQYTLADKLRVFDADAATFTIPAKDGARFLVHDANTTVVSAQTVLVWLATDEDISNYLAGEDQ